MSYLIPPLNHPVRIIPGLYQSGLIITERPIVDNKIEVVFDLAGSFDKKFLSKHLILYVFWKIEDGPLPNLEHLSQLSSLAFWYHARGLNVLTHCAMGLNRSSLFNGMVLWKRGCRGPEIVESIKRALPIALTNEVFKKYLLNLI